MAGVFLNIMKTAMQDLIEYIESRYFDWEITEILQKSKQLLEKEKEQIIAPINYYKKQSCTAFDDDYIHTGEEYYNQTYNQNK